MYKYPLPHKAPESIDINEFMELYNNNTHYKYYPVIMVCVRGQIRRNKNSWATIVDDEAFETYWFEKGDQDKDFTFYGTLREWEIQHSFYEFIKWEFIEVLVWEETTTRLNPFIEELYRLKETEKNALCYKIILNSMYGSAGMKHTYPTLFFEKKDIAVPYSYKENDKEYIYIQEKNENFFRDYLSYDYVELKDEKTKCWNKWIAAFITSYGRAILMEYIAKDPEKMVYCDTDSMIGLVDSESFNQLPKGKGLGDWDVDKKDINYVFVQGAKRYFLYRNNEEPIKIGFAGVKKDEVFYNGFETDVSLAQDELIEDGQRRVVKDKKFFPFIEDNDYLNRKVIHWNSQKLQGD